MSYQLILCNAELTIEVDTDQYEFLQLLRTTRIYKCFTLFWGRRRLKLHSAALTWYDEFDDDLEVLRKAGVRGSIESVSKKTGKHEKYFLDDESVKQFWGQIHYHPKATTDSITPVTRGGSCTLRQGS